MSKNANKVWFVTGASRGLGLAIARDALQRGDFVVATARRPEVITAALGDQENLLALPLDVTDGAQAVHAANAAIDRYGRIDVLVNNAGYGLLAAVEEASSDEVERQFATNVFGLLKVTRAVLPHLRRARKGHVVNISAIVGYAAVFAGWGIYGATKFAVEAITETLAIELAPLGIFATAVEPGFFRTDFLDPASLRRTTNVIGDYADVEAMRHFATAVNHEQPGDPDKLSQAVLALADSAKPPVRLPLGADTVAKIEEKNRSVEAELAQWRAVALSTKRDDVAA